MARVLHPPPVATPRKVVITTDWRPSSALQHAVLDADERFIDATGGRRVGKSDVIAPWLTGIHEWAPGRTRWGAVWTPGGRFLYTAPQRSPNCVDFYDKLKSACAAAGILKDKSDVDLYVKIFNDAEIQAKSTERPDNLRGPGYDGIATDEKGTTPEEAYNVLAPTLSDPPDKCIRRWLRVGSPRGKKHWTYREHVYGLGGPSGPYGRVAFAFPTWSRPGLEEECARARKILPENVYRQEYGAEFLDNAAGYFQRLVYDGAPSPLNPEPEAIYTAGIDLAHTEDWTVVVVVRARPTPMRVVAVERWGRSPWPLTKERIVGVLRRWSADALIDATPGGAPGDVTIEAFAPEWRRIDGFDPRSQRGATRDDMLASLAIALEQDELVLPGTAQAPAFPILTAELDGFVYEMTPSGRARACAGPNLNDDTVFALGLAAWKAKRAAARSYASRKTF